MGTGWVKRILAMRGNELLHTPENLRDIRMRRLQQIRPPYDEVGGS